MLVMLLLIIVNFQRRLLVVCGNSFYSNLWYSVVFDSGYNSEREIYEETIRQNTKGYVGDKIMKAYGKKLWWIEEQHYGDEMHTGIPLPSSGKRRGQRRKRYERPFKKMERQHSKNEIRKIVESVDNAEV